MLGQGVAHRRLHEVDALAGILGHHVAGVVHHVGVVAHTARQAVGTRAAIQQVVTLTAEQGVGARTAVQRVVAQPAIQ
ncbi:hypothetical protein D3C84_971080 [compost metagenome]